MDSEDRKLQLRIARRKEKVERMIGEQRIYLDELNPSAFPNRHDYLRAVSNHRKKLHRMEREMQADGRLPGPWAS